MGLEERRLREAGELAQRQTADELHLRVLGSIGAVLVQHGCRRRILRNVLMLITIILAKPMPEATTSCRARIGITSHSL